MDSAVPNYTTQTQAARKFGVHEITLRSSQPHANPFTPLCTVTFTPPSARAAEKTVSVDAFYDGGDTWRARVYLSESGEWRWSASAPADPQLDGQSGAFSCADSVLRGRLLPRPDCPTHWMTEDGRGFLNLNDTAYHLFRAAEPDWQAYLRDDAALGITSVRASSLGGPAWQLPSGADSWPWQGADTSRFNLARFQTTDQRLRWMLDELPDLYVQFILLGLIEWGKDSTGEAWFALPTADRLNTLRYMLARWAAFPQIFWLIVNDMHCTPDFPNNHALVREVGAYVAAHDPWHHLLSVGPRRKMAFPFHPHDNPWVSYVHIEEQYDLNAEAMQAYQGWDLPVFLGEDRYEQDRATRDPRHPAYFFRWLFWSWLLAGGSASYGGRWRTLTPYTCTGQVPYATGWGGDDEITYTRGLSGLDSLLPIQRFFSARGLDLGAFQPDDSLLVNPPAPYPPHMARRAWEEILGYHPNPRPLPLEEPNPQRLLAPADSPAQFTLDLRQAPHAFSVEWYRPTDGLALPGETLPAGQIVTLTAPWPADVVCHLKRHEAARKLD